FRRRIHARRAGVNPLPFQSNIQHHFVSKEEKLMNLKLKLIPLLLLPLLASGCGGGNVSRLKTHPVEGQVQFEGRPLEGAFEVLHPKGVTDPKILPAHAKTDAAGKFKATTYDAH